MWVGLIPAMAWAQTAEPKQGAFLFCMVTDLGTMPPKTWASSVLATDISANQRSNELASDFLRRVNALGGAGNKMCLVSTNRTELETLREQQRASSNERFLLMKVGDWHDVDWTPAPWNPSTAAAVPAQVTRWYYCSSTQFYSPGCNGRSCSVASQVFSMPSPSGVAAAFAQTRTYAAAFEQVALARGISENGGATCQDFDTRAEADKSHRDNRNLLDGFNQKYTELAWVPSTQAAAPAPATSATQTQPAAAISPPANAVAALAVPVPVVQNTSLYCIGFVMRAKPALLVRTPIRKEADPNKSHADMSASLAGLFAAVQRANPGDWQALPATQCGEGGTEIKGETFCFAVANSFLGGVQQLGSFCNASRELIDKRDEAMAKADGGQPPIVPWPDKP